MTQDARSDRVVVLADEGSSPGLIAQQYGDIVRVVPSHAGGPGQAARRQHAADRCSSERGRAELGVGRRG